ncbi:MAG: 4Fe-4S dicluster domain-containing protein [Pseudomonadota bacterium]
MLLKTTKAALLKGIDQVLLTYQVAALTKQVDRVLYDYVKTSQDIFWGCRPTVLPPKKFFFPPHETLLDYTADGQVSAPIESKPLVLLGIHPCDLRGIQILDEAFADLHGDPNYLERREKAIIIGLDCHQNCDQDSFCYKVGANYAKTGYDIMLYPLKDDQYLVEIATDRGSVFAEQFLRAIKGEETELEEYQQTKAKAFESLKPFKDLEKFPELFQENTHHPIWAHEGARCLSCGSCVMVCPTCYCFNVTDDWALNMQTGKRERHWDGCMLHDFTTVATGENFRPTATARLHHRINRKFNYLMKKHGQAVCVGCGRCVRACLAEISPKTIAEAINGEDEKEWN